VEPVGVVARIGDPAFAEFTGTAAAFLAVQHAPPSADMEVRQMQGKSSSPRPNSLCRRTGRWRGHDGQLNGVMPPGDSQRPAFRCSVRGRCFRAAKLARSRDVPPKRGTPRWSGHYGVCTPSAPRRKQGGNEAARPAGLPWPSRAADDGDSRGGRRRPSPRSAGQRGWRVAGEPARKGIETSAGAASI
jgi:hypothetical protein